MIYALQLSDTNLWLRKCFNMGANTVIGVEIGKGGCSE
jgi:hypothetical protein